MELWIPFIIGAVCILGLDYFYFRDKLNVFMVIFLWSLIWFIYPLIFPDFFITNTTKIDVLLLPSTACLGAGYIMYQNKIGHYLMLVGWQCFGIYWDFQIPTYLYQHPGDYINIIIYAPALTLFSVFSYYEMTKPNESLKYIGGVTFISSAIYFSFEKINFLGEILIRNVASQTSYLLNHMGYNTYLGETAVDIFGEVSVPIVGTSIAIILACTAIEAMVIFIGALACINPEKNVWQKRKGEPYIKLHANLSPKKRIIVAFLYTIPVIWVLNLVRNVAIIHLVETGTTSFDVAHGYLGKTFSFFVLLGLSILVFDVVPEIQDHLFKLMDLGKEKKEEEE